MRIPRLVLLTAALAVAVSAAEPLDFASPNGDVHLIVTPRPGAPFSYAVTFRGQPVLEPARLGLLLDGANLTTDATVAQIERYARNETYATRGVHPVATDRANGARLTLRSPAGEGVLEVRVFDDGAAFRWLVPAAGGRGRVPDVATDFRLPVGSTAWYHDLGGHYEGVYAARSIAGRRDPAAAPTPRAGEWAGIPLTAKLPGGTGYAFITESALMDFPGMALQADRNSVFRARLGHAHPASYPFVLRYGLDEADRLAQPPAFTGAITTPWYLVGVAADLHGLVNSDLVTNLAPPPDPALFPEGVNTSWLRPGRALWRYLDGGESTLEGMREFADLAGQLGFEHNIIEGFWRRWTPEELKGLVDYSRARGVGLWLWTGSNELHTDEQRKKFFALCAAAGVAGAKVDFLDHEAKGMIDVYQGILREAAAHRIMLNFHGANKPAGEARTWPNELTREGVQGYEHRSAPLTWTAHHTIVPFTRFLAGPAEVTPVHFGERRRGTTWANQLATTIVFTTPLFTYAAHPRALLANPAVDFIRSTPTVWDETIVLPGSEIGEVAAFARRSGDRWFLGVVNGPAARTLTVDLAFLPAGARSLLAFGDVEGNDADLTKEERPVTRADRLTLSLRPGGGYVARFDP